MKLPAILLLAGFSMFAADAPKHLASIEFFGYQGIDIEAVRRELPVHEGDAFPGKRSHAQWKRLIEEAVRKSLGKPATDVRFVCCTQEGDFTLYLGLPGANYAPIAFHAKPGGTAKLPRKLVQLNDRVSDAAYHAIMQGQAGEDRSQGYSLFQEPKTKALQLAFREEVLRNEEVVYNVLATSSNASQRGIAAEALGYAHRSDRQRNALVAASLDPDDSVRNNATRALGVLLTAFPDIAADFPLAPFMTLTASGSWLDRNKASFVLERLTATRDPKILAQVRASPALASIIEIAKWRDAGHASFGIMILGRVAGVDESELERPLTPDQARAIIDRVRK